MSLPAPILLDGSWERPGKNPLGGGIAGVILCGALYTFLGGVSLSITVAVLAPFDTSWLGAESFVDLVVSYYRRFQFPILVVTAAMEFAVFLVLTFLLVRRWHSSRPAQFLAFRRPAVANLVLAAVGAVAVVPVAELLDRWAYVLIPALRELAQGESSLLSIRSPAQLVVVVAAVALMPAICEEVLFRGWLQGTLRRRLSAPLTIVIQGFLFALFHMSPLSIVALAFVGFYLGFLFDRSGTLFASMTAHSVYNGTIIAMVNLDTRLDWLTVESGDLAWPVIAVAAVVFSAVVVLIELGSRKRLRREEVAEVVPE